ncbi:MAG TPA: 3'-5' exonuclease [Acidimicrobiales bacterium]|nr:3'-5' exonuclease [Acidimicrobiales bacterium]
MREGEALVYGLDIETDTSCGGLDPRRCRILAVAVAGPHGVTVLTGAEPGLLATLDRHLASLQPGVVVTWNGSSFDLPFLADRAAFAGIELGMRLRLDPGMDRTHPPLPGHGGRYRAGWHDHRHLDAYSAYRSLLAGDGESCGLKAVARRAGLSAVEVDAARVHQLSGEQLSEYVASDARLARRLALSRWDEVIDFVDPQVVPARAPALAAQA